MPYDIYRLKIEYVIDLMKIVFDGSLTFKLFAHFVDAKQFLGY